MCIVTYKGQNQLNELVSSSIDLESFYIQRKYAFTQSLKVTL